MAEHPYPAVLASRPLIFAHRGGAALAPENTLPAFDHAAALGVDGFELDVHLSVDGFVMVHHDPRLDRTTDATGAIARRTAEELSQVDAAYTFHPESGYPWRGRQIGVPRLSEVLARHPDKRVIVEVKGMNPKLIDATLDDMRRADALDRVSLGAYSNRMLVRARRAEPRLATGAGYEETRWALYRTWIGWRLRPPYQVYDVPEVIGRTRIVSPRFIQFAHAAGVRVYVWTVNQPDDIRRLLTWGADGIITDRPDVALQIREDWISQVRGAPAG